MSGEFLAMGIFLNDCEGSNGVSGLIETSGFRGRGEEVFIRAKASRYSTPNQKLLSFINNSSYGT